MATRTRHDTLLSATRAVFKALEPLRPEEKQRVLASVSSLLGVSAPDIPSPNTPGVLRSPPTADDRRLSLSELFLQKQPATNAQRIAVFAYYRDKAESKPHFERADLKPYFGMVREKSPGTNYEREYGKAVKLGYIHDDGSQSYITNSGIRAVEAGFGGRAQPRGRAAKAAKGKRKPSK